MKNPYKTLNVPKDASEKEIKKAYRNKAKEKHPDTGGDKEEFTEIAKAYALLINPEKREYYDEHGEDVKSSDTVVAGAMTVIHQMIDSIFEQYNEQNIVHFDFIAEMVKQTNQRLFDIKKMIESSHKSIEKLDKMENVFKKRLKHKKSAISINFFNTSILNKKKVIKKSIEDYEHHKKIYEKMIEFLSDFEFEIETAPGVHINNFQEYVNFINKNMGY